MSYFVEIETLMMDGESKVWVKTITAHNVTEQTLNLILEQYMSNCCLGMSSFSFSQIFRPKG